MNKLTVYEGNSILITLTVTNSDGTDADFSGFTVTIHIKQNKDDITDLLDATGSVTNNVVIFSIDATDNDLLMGVYYYEVIAESATEKYTLVQDRLFVKESIVYVT
jgi:hypothetical protein